MNFPKVDAKEGIIAGLEITPEVRFIGVRWWLL